MIHQGQTHLFSQQYKSFSKDRLKQTWVFIELKLTRLFPNQVHSVAQVKFKFRSQFEVLSPIRIPIILEIESGIISIDDVVTDNIRKIVNGQKFYQGRSTALAKYSCKDFQLRTTRQRLLLKNEQIRLKQNRNSIKREFVKKTIMPNPVKSLRSMKCYSSGNVKYLKALPILSATTVKSWKKWPRVFQIVLRGGGIPPQRKRRWICWGDFLSGGGNHYPEEEWLWRPFSKLKTKFCKYWILIKIKISMTCIYEEYDDKIKMVQEQWL